jgi:hypothetical protein
MQIKPTDSLLLKGRVGSHAFGLANKDSDEDFQGIFVAPTQAFLGLAEKLQESYSFKNPDTTYHEVGKYCRLALKCNPTVLDLMWLDEYNVRTELGTELINLRSNFLSRKYVKDAYLGYAQSQLGKLNKDPRPEKRSKNARHFLRLLNHGFSLYTTGTYSVRLRNPEEFVDLGNRIGGEGDVDLAKEILGRYENWFKHSLCALPETPNSEPIENWLLKVRHEFYSYTEPSNLQPGYFDRNPSGLVGERKGWPF